MKTPIAAKDLRSGRAGRRVVVLTTLAGLLLVLELGLRIWLGAFAPTAKRAKYARPGELASTSARYVPHPFLSYALNPRFESEDGLDRHNALGFRGRELAVPQTPGTYRIVCVGGSTVYDTEIADHRQSFPDQLEQCLQSMGHDDVQVVNGGVGGYTSSQTLVDLALRVLEIEPDLLVIYHNSNDVHARLVPPEHFHPDGSGYRRSWEHASPWWDHSMLLRFLGVQWGFSPRNTLSARTKIGHAPERDMEACLAANSPRWFERNTEAMVALARARGARVLLSSYATCPERGGYPARPWYRRGFEQHDAVLRAVAERARVPFYDFRAEMPLEPGLWDDGVHNTPAGARRKAELFAAFIDSHFLAARRGG